jgi:hypothetical protein
LIVSLIYIVVLAETLPQLEDSETQQDALYENRITGD